VKLDPADLPALKPLITVVVRATLEELQAADAKLDGRLAYPEPEAAALLGVAPHVLRDARRRGELSARLCGKRYLYDRRELLRFLESTNA